MTAAHWRLCPVNGRAARDDHKSDCSRPWLSQPKCPSKHQFKVYIAGQKRLVTDTKRYNIQSRLAVEPVIAHVKDDHRTERNCLVDNGGDAIDAILAAGGYNFRCALTPD